MKTKYRFLCIIICFVLSNTSGMILGKQATIIFNTERNIMAYIYKPIDDMYNDYTISDQLELKPNISIAYRLDVVDFCFVKIAYSNGLQYSLIIQENDELEVTLKENGIILEGSNSIGNVYLNNFNRYAFVDSIFDLHIKPSVDIAAINADLYKTFWKDFNDDLERLRLEENISYNFVRILSNDIGYAIAGMVVKDYYKVIFGYKGKITQEESTKIIAQIDSIYQIYPPWSNDVMKYRYSMINGYISKYYQEKYNNLSLQEKNELLQKYEPDTFGPYFSYLLAPAHIQLPQFGFAFIVQLDYMSDEFNKDKMLKYIETHFPDSQYLQLIKKRLKETLTKNELERVPESVPLQPGMKEILAKNELSKGSNDSIIIINEQVNTLQELFSLYPLKGHRLYIDLWATWCFPCKTEFLYKNDLYTVAEEYNIKLVYLSIDNVNSKKRWESDIFRNELMGYHFLANESLLQDIKNIIFKNQTIAIPRYVFVNEKGEIVDDNAPRPSKSVQLKSIFAEALK